MPSRLVALARWIGAVAVVVMYLGVAGGCAWIIGGMPPDETTPEDGPSSCLGTIFGESVDSGVAGVSELCLECLNEHDTYMSSDPFDCYSGWGSAVAACAAQCAGQLPAIYADGQVDAGTDAAHDVSAPGDAQTMGDGNAHDAAPDVTRDDAPGDAVRDSVIDAQPDVSAPSDAGDGG